MKKKTVDRITTVIAVLAIVVIGGMLYLGLESSTKTPDSTPTPVETTETTQPSPAAPVRRESLTDDEHNFFEGVLDKVRLLAADGDAAGLIELVKSHNEAVSLGCVWRIGGSVYTVGDTRTQNEAASKVGLAVELGRPWTEVVIETAPYPPIIEHTYDSKTGKVGHDVVEQEVILFLGVVCYAEA